MNIDTFKLEKSRKIVRPFPNVERYTCSGAPAFRVKKKLLARLREDGETLAVHCDHRDNWMHTGSDIFFISEHCKNCRFVEVKLGMAMTMFLNKCLRRHGNCGNEDSAKTI
jgi:hypothetical protein